MLHDFKRESGEDGWEVLSDQSHRGVESEVPLEDECAVAPAALIDAPVPHRERRPAVLVMNKRDTFRSAHAIAMRAVGETLDVAIRKVGLKLAVNFEISPRAGFEYGEVPVLAVGSVEEMASRADASEVEAPHSFNLPPPRFNSF